MDILSMLPIIIMIFAIVTKLNSGASKTSLGSRNPRLPSSPWAHDLGTSLQKWLSYENPTPTSKNVEVQKEYQVIENSWLVNSSETEGTAGEEGTPGVEGTPGTEATFKPTISSEVESSHAEESFFPDLAEKNLTEAVIWAEILGKPRSRINRPLSRIY